MRPLKIKLITLDKSFMSWRSKKSKLKRLTEALMTMKNIVNVDIDAEYRDLVPSVLNGRITHEWMDSISEFYRQWGYDLVAIHMSNAQRKKWGIQPSLRGAYHIDLDFIDELYFWADEKTKRGRYNQWEQVFAHEVRHALKRGTNRIDDTHAIHGEGGNILTSFSTIDYAEYHPGRQNLELQKSLLTQALNWLKVIASRASSKSRRQQLFDKAVSYLLNDASPEDRADDEVGCAESVSCIIRDVLPDFPIITGTWTLKQEFEADKRFKAVTTPMPGDIVISPTGDAPGAAFPGHVGIFGPDLTIMSNDSSTGLWEANYDLDTWRARWGKAGYPVQIYSLIN